MKLGFIGQKIAKDEKIARQKEALSQVNLDYLSLSDKIYTLSGGEEQRTAWAKIILKNPPIILADESTAVRKSLIYERVIQLFINVDIKKMHHN